jgi:uncharacterized membrane protein
MNYKAVGGGIVVLGVALAVIGVVLFHSDYEESTNLGFVTVTNQPYKAPGLGLMFAGIIVVVVGAVVSVSSDGSSSSPLQYQQYGLAFSGQVAYCQYCGRLIAPDAVYCPGCGRSSQK